MKFESWHTDKKHIKLCKMPYTVTEKDSRTYRLLLRCHCAHPDKNNNDHRCVGRITITHKVLLTQCTKCGDAKGLIQNERVDNAQEASQGS